MSIIDRIGIDIGPAAEAPLRIPAAKRAGARIVRVRLSLDGGSTVDAQVLATARAAVEAAKAARLRLLAVIDSDLTVAPGGAGGEGVPPSVAAAWGRELAANAGKLAAAIGADVAAWEVLPGPNWHGATGGKPRLAPERWAALVGEIADALRQGHAEAHVVAGALISDAEDDGVAYLRAAAAAGGWRSARGAPCDALSMQLAILPEGGPSEGVVAATVAERVQRLWRAAQSAIAGARRPNSMWVTGVSWDAVYAGEAAQARNLWTALDTLTADPTVAGVVWTALVDQSARNGLFAGPSLDPAARRPAWTAFHDFATYARQISPAVGASAWSLEDVAEDDANESMGLTGEVIEGNIVGSQAHEKAAGSEVEESVEVEVEAPDTAGHGIMNMGEDEAADDESTASGTAVRFKMPTIEDVLRGEGLSGARLAAALGEIDLRYGSREWLPPGDYEIDVPPEGGTPIAPTSMEGSVAPSEIDRGSSKLETADGVSSTDEPSALTNQGVLSALYRAGGGTWTLLEGVGLDLAELVTRRDGRYEGPDLATSPELSDEQRAAVARALNDA